MRRVVITGIGAVTPIGNDAKATWEAALAGRSGVDEIRSFDASEYPVSIAGEVKDFDAQGLASAKDMKRLDPNVVFALGAGKEALADAGVNGFRPDRVGIVLGSAIGGFTELMRQADILRERGFDRVSPTFIPNVLVDAASGQLAIELRRRLGLRDRIAHDRRGRGAHSPRPR
jgi:3-oxoacyl-[acyl-carrier-protein] synthase II